MRITPISRAISAGIAVRIAYIPFIQQWFFPDERQILEFAHFHAHGRLHPFLESELHLRNQTLPWLLSKLIVVADSMGLSTPQAYLSLIYLLLTLNSAVAMVLMIRIFSELTPRSQRAHQYFAWFSALFWPFIILNSRMLAETLSLTPTLLLFWAYLKDRPVLAGLGSGLSALTRYPSLLWSLGALLMSVFEKKRIRTLGIAILVALSVIAIGGLADWFTYGSWLESWSQYLTYNQPGGPVETAFGTQPLYVYMRWFEFCFTPWIAPFFVIASLAALTYKANRKVLLFLAPYILGHLISSHREPRFMLPVLPFLCFAIGVAWLELRKNGKLNPPPLLRRLAMGLLVVHILINLAWIPINAYAQWNSAQAIWTRSYRTIEKRPIPVVTAHEPLIDVFVPTASPWMNQEDCTWNRPTHQELAAEFWYLSESAPESCSVVRKANLQSIHIKRLTRVRTAHLWVCPIGELERVCPGGTRPSPPGYPYKRVPPGG